MLKKWFDKKEKEGSRAGEDPASEAVSPSGAPSAGEAAGKQAGAAEPKRSAWSLFKRGLAKTRKGLSSVLAFRRKLDEAYVDDLESELYAADFGPAAVDELLDGEEGIRWAWKQGVIDSVEDVREYLKKLLRGILEKRDNGLIVAAEKPTVVLVAGVNGTGKTTSIAKLAHRLKSEGRTVILAAADTFRAAAVEQLTIWSERLGIDIIVGKAGADPGSVAYRGAEAALEKGADFLIVDTAGRLHTQRNLMRELEKIRAVLGKKIPGAPHETLLVLDATTGQNAVMQARSFLEAVQVTGIVLAKLDGTAKGGIVITINNRLEIPVKLVGVGEKLEDLQVFHPDHFVEALLETD